MFYVGQKVVCVDDHDTKHVVKGQIYTVRTVRRRFLELYEVRGEFADGMLATRFRPVVERKTDISDLVRIAQEAARTGKVLA